MFGASQTPAVEKPLDISALGRSELADVSAASHQRERLERMIQNEIVPRLMLTHRAGPIPPSLASTVARQLTDADVASFIAAIRGHADDQAAVFVRGLVSDGTPIETIYLDLLAPTARRLGTLWDADECDFIEVTVALGRMQRLLRDLSQEFLAESGRTEPVGNVLLTCVPGEQHTLGVIIVAEFLLRDGWRVLVGAPWTESDLMAMASTEWFDVIGFSVGCENRLSTLKREISRLRKASRNPNVRVMVGGKVFSDDADMCTRVGADAFATDAREAPHIARTLKANATTLPSKSARREATSGHSDLSEAVRRD